VYDAFGAAGKKGQALEDEWNKVLIMITEMLIAGDWQASLATLFTG